MATTFSKVRIAGSFLLAFSLALPSVGTAGVPHWLTAAHGFSGGQTSITDGAGVVLVENQRDYTFPGQGPRANGNKTYQSDFCRNNPQRCTLDRDRGDKGDHRSNGGLVYDRNDDHPRYRGGYRGYSNQRQGYRRADDGWWYPLAAFALGAIIVNQYNKNTHAYDHQGGGSWSHIPDANMAAHDNWCDRRYRSYSRSSKTYQPYHGPRQYCNSPYDRL